MLTLCTAIHWKVWKVLGFRIAWMKEKSNVTRLFFRLGNTVTS